MSAREDFDDQQLARMETLCFSAEWDRQFADLSASDKEAIAAQPTGFVADQLYLSVKTAVRRRFDLHELVATQSNTLDEIDAH
jgi:hypothetical protein